MLEIEKIVFPESLSEAAEIYQNQSESVVLGGCVYLRLGSRKIATAIDLSKLRLDAVHETDSHIEIGAMTTLRSLETNPLLQNHASGVLARAVENIVGVQLRNCVTLGGSVAGRYPFSDPITALLALDAKVLLQNSGIIPLKDYLAGKALRDILVSIQLPKDGRKAAFTSVRKSKTDYAVLNCAVAEIDKTFRVVVGARPNRATRATDAEVFLDENGLTPESASRAGKLAAAQMQFGDNPRGSRAYRAKICPVLVQRALLEVYNAG